jgi:CheY-like chemotaxis protein
MARSQTPRNRVVNTVEPAGDGSALRLMLVDTRPERRLLVRHLVESTGLAATDIGEAASTAEAIELLDHQDRDVAIVEIQMPVSQGLETIAALRSRSPGLRIVVCSFRCDSATKERALGQGADAYLDKPVSTSHLKALLRGFGSEPSSGSEAPPQEDLQPLVIGSSRRRPDGRGPSPSRRAKQLSDPLGGSMSAARSGSGSARGVAPVQSAEDSPQLWLSCGGRQSGPQHR